MRNEVEWNNKSNNNNNKIGTQRFKQEGKRINGFIYLIQNYFDIYLCDNFEKENHPLIVID